MADDGNSSLTRRNLLGGAAAAAATGLGFLVVAIKNAADFTDEPVRSSRNMWDDLLVWAGVRAPRLTPTGQQTVDILTGKSTSRLAPDKDLEDVAGAAVDVFCYTSLTYFLSSEITSDASTHLALYSGVPAYAGLSATDQQIVRLRLLQTRNQVASLYPGNPMRQQDFIEDLRGILC